MSLVRPNSASPELWNFATSPNHFPLVIILKSGFRVICDRKIGPYVNIPAADPADTSGLEVVVRGQNRNLPWTEIVGICPQLETARIPGIRSFIDNQLQPHFPAVNHWIDGYIAQTKSRARSLSEFKAFDLGKAFRRATLDNAFAVEELRPAKIPLSQMGLAEFRDFELMQVSAITYKSTFFVVREGLTASLAFHEMVHVVQWDEIGPENFLTSYAIGLKAWGYYTCPLEAMAYSLEALYNGHNLPTDPETFIREQTRLIFADPLTHPSTCLNI